MNNNNDLKDIFDAMDEINKINENRKKNKEILLLDKNLYTTAKSRFSKEKNIPIETEKLIKQAEKQLNSIKEK